MSVVRYNFVNDYHYCGCGEVEDDNGEYVEYADYQKLLGENAQLRAAIDRVRALHQRKIACVGWSHEPICAECKYANGERADYPCSTIKALDGGDA